MPMVSFIGTALREKDTGKIHIWPAVLQSLADYLPTDMQPPTIEDPKKTNQAYPPPPRFNNRGYARGGRGRGRGGRPGGRGGHGGGGGWRGTPRGRGGGPRGGNTWGPMYGRGNERHQQMRGNSYANGYNNGDNMDYNY